MGQKCGCLSKLQKENTYNTLSSTTNVIEKPFNEHSKSKKIKSFPPTLDVTATKIIKNTSTKSRKSAPCTPESEAKAITNPFNFDGTNSRNTFRFGMVVGDEYRRLNTNSQSFMGFNIDDIDNLYIDDIDDDEYTNLNIYELELHRIITFGFLSQISSKSHSM
eukprot:429339_1